MTPISSVPDKSVRCREVSAIKDVRYKEVSLHFINTDIKRVRDTKKIWETIKLYFSNKGLYFSKISSSEKERLIKDPVAVATAMNDYFCQYHENYRTKSVLV